MRPIQSSNRALNLFGAGKHGFQAGDPEAGLLATFLTPEWCNGVQEEIMNVIRDAGITQSGSDFSQLLQALNILFAGRTPGEVRAFARTDAPAGWLKCNGAAVSRATYAGLFAVIGTTFGNGNGTTTFNLPDLRGEFIRGLDDGRGVDAGRDLGTAQAQQLLQHTHGVTDPGHTHVATVTDPGHIHTATVTDPGHTHTFRDAAGGTTPPVNANASTATGSVSDTGSSTTGITVAVNNHDSNVTVANASSDANVSINNTGGAESRPRNVALLYCIST